MKRPVKCEEEMIHIGKRVPNGFVELPGSIHLGGGIWIFKCEKVKE